MKTLFYLTFITSFLFSLNSYGQGGWNIDYIQVDSVSFFDVGKDVKLDFIGKLEINPVNSLQKRAIISQVDTAIILIDEKEVEFIEIRNIHSDWGFYDEQYIECKGYSANQSVRIYHTVIEDLNDTSIKFRFYIEVYNKDRKGNLLSDPNRWCRSVWVNKEKLDGLMIKQKTK